MRRIRGLLILVTFALVFSVTVTSSQMATEQAIWNNVWDRANQQIMGTPWAGAQGSFETTQAILNNVWDKPNNRLRITGGGGGGGGTWGTITGTLSAQTDLQAALDAKEPLLGNAAADGVTKGKVGFVANDFDCTTGICGLDYLNGQKASGAASGFLSSTDW